MKIKNSLVTAVSVCGLFFTVQSGFAQGSLTPPGAPAPTMKTLTQIEPRTPISSLPFTITTPGSYYVTSNLTGVSGSDGIDISASDVTLDLNGFTLLGVAGSGSGIAVLNAQSNLAIRNGVLDSWEENGVSAGYGSGSQFERLRVSDCNAGLNPSEGYYLDGALNAGNNCLVLACTVISNQDSGINVGVSCTVKDCVANANSDIGIEGGGYGNVIGCIANFNGLAGISTSGGSTVKGCTANANGNTSIKATGIACGIQCTVEDCTASDNNSEGINVFDNGTVKDCTASDNDGDGIYVEHNSTDGYPGTEIGSGTVKDCTAGGNGGHGIYVESYGAVSGCTASANWEDGIYVYSSTVKDCNANNNGEDGIYVGYNNSLIAGNTCSGNMLSGIEIDGSLNRIDGNNASNNQKYGIIADSLNVTNCITHNSAPGNFSGGYGGYTGNNDYAPIGTPNTSTNPWQNF